MLGVDTEWPEGPDGLPTRCAARVVLIDRRARQVLLVRGHDYDNPEHSWWFSVGGGVEDGEDTRLAAVRECAEETGYVLTCDELCGPVIERNVVMRFARRDRRQYETFYLAFVDRFDVDTASWTDDEHQLLDGIRWLNVDDLAALATRESIYPAVLVDLVPKWASSGWSGECLVYEDLDETR